MKQLIIEASTRVFVTNVNVYTRICYVSVYSSLHLETLINRIHYFAISAKSLRCKGKTTESISSLNDMARFSIKHDWCSDIQGRMQYSWLIIKQD